MQLEYVFPAIVSLPQVAFEKCCQGGVSTLLLNGALFVHKFAN
jgi:hypothetical protein